MDRAKSILAVDDHELVRLGLRAVIARHFGDRFAVAEAQSIEQALVFLGRHADDTALVLLDLNLTDIRGLAGLRLLRHRYPQLPVAVVSGAHDPRVRIEALGHGAVAYVRKTGESGSTAELIEAIRKFADVPQGIAPTAADRPAPIRTPAFPAGEIKLSPRQVQVLDLVLGGHDNRAISQETGLTLGSVKNCVSSIFLNFNVRSRAELIGLFAR